MVKDVESTHAKNKGELRIKKMVIERRGLKKKVIEKKVKDVESAQVTNMI